MKVRALLLKSFPPRIMADSRAAAAAGASTALPEASRVLVFDEAGRVLFSSFDVSFSDTRTEKKTNGWCPRARRSLALRTPHRATTPAACVLV